MNISWTTHCCLIHGRQTQNLVIKRLSIRVDLGQFIEDGRTGLLDLPVLTLAEVWGRDTATHCGLAGAGGVRRDWVTKTLAKLANHCAKKALAGEGGVCDFTTMAPDERLALFERIQVGEVWGRWAQDHCQTASDGHSDGAATA